MALACAIGSTGLDADVVVGLFNVEVVTALEDTLGEAVGIEGLLGVKGKRRIVLEEGLGPYGMKDVFDEVLRFKRGPARGGCNCGCICASGCLVTGSAVAVGTTREV